jgi:hypothetical protein
LERNHHAEIRYLGCNRERRIFVARRLAEKPMTLEELGEEFGVSRERVRQIETRAFEKVKKASSIESGRRRPAGCRDALMRFPERSVSHRKRIRKAGSFSLQLVKIGFVHRRDFRP